MKAILLAALAAAGAHAAVPELYVRGGFNGWGIDNPLVARGPNLYEAVIELPPGYHGFKLGARDWSAEWVLDPTASVSVKPGQNYRLEAHAGPEDFLFVRKMARYRFILDAGAAPTLRIEELPAAATQAVDPHPPGSQPEVWRFPTWDGKTEEARFSALPVIPADAGTSGRLREDGALRSYVQSTTQTLRDPVPSFVRYSEQADLPRVRSGSVAFDALFAMALTEFKQDSVARIADGNYNGGEPIPCACFETGERWHYVWTRDLSYAANLGLALLDPERVRNSLEFKLSGYRPGLA
ncbi:MAG TPA: esterase, partial [Telluria sp.]|nr:esterase [Telluria sp.]